MARHTCRLVGVAAPLWLEPEADRFKAAARQITFG